MDCRKCKKEIPDSALYCPWCGKKQTAAPSKSKKNANGMGSVYKMQSRKSRPWAAMVTLDKKRVYLGTFATETEAKKALAAAQINGVSEKHTYTLEALYAEWADIHYRELTPSGVQGYRTAWNYLEPIKKMKVREIKTCHFQECIDLCAEKYSRAQCEKIRQLASQLCKKAMEYDLLNKNYAQFLSLPKAQQKGRDIFTTAEIRKLKKHDSDETARIILTLIYTGFRPNELFSVTLDNVYLSKGYIIGGSKTEAGIDRRVPIHPDILPYVREWYEQRTADSKVVSLDRYLIETQNNAKMDLKNFRSRRFYPLLIELGILKYPKGEKCFSKDKPPRLTPYSARHTFASLASCAGVKPEILQQIMGHEDYATTVNIKKPYEQLKKLKQLEYVCERRQLGGVILAVAFCYYSNSVAILCMAFLTSEFFIPVQQYLFALVSRPLHRFF